jgi:hypothetical protein
MANAHRQLACCHSHWRASLTSESALRGAIQLRLGQNLATGIAAEFLARLLERSPVVGSVEATRTAFYCDVVTGGAPCRAASRCAPADDRQGQAEQCAGHASTYAGEVRA